MRGGGAEVLKCVVLDREWRMLRAIRHPHICTLVDRMRYENRKVGEAA